MIYTIVKVYCIKLMYEYKPINMDCRYRGIVNETIFIYDFCCVRLSRQHNTLCGSWKFNRRTCI